MRISKQKIAMGIGVDTTKHLYRKDDGQQMTRNDDGTYSFTHQYISMPTTYYRYELDMLLKTGCFEFLEEDIN